MGCKHCGQPIEQFRGRWRHTCCGTYSCDSTGYGPYAEPAGGSDWQHACPGPGAEGGQ